MLHFRRILLAIMFDISIINFISDYETPLYIGALIGALAYIIAFIIIKE